MLPDIKITYPKYIADVLSGKIRTNRFVRLAVERHVRDLDDLTKKGYYFDEKHAEKVIKFFSMHPHVEGEWADRNELITWQPWQQFIIASLYGWKRSSGYNRFTLGYVEIPRKNAKSTLAAVACSKALIFDRSQGAQIYTAATKEAQAKIVWGIAEKMIRKNPYLKEFVVIRTKTLSVPETYSKFEPLGRDSDTQDGLNTSMAVIDEYHAWKYEDLFRVIRTSQGTRKDRLILIITTGGFNTQGPCYRQRKSIINILEEKTTNTEHIFGMIWTIDDPKKWQDPEQWKIVNPNYGISLDPSFFQEEFDDAMRDGGSAEVNFKTKLLNLWGGSSDTWIPDADVKACDHGLNPDELLGQECHGGLDLANVDDFAVLSLIFNIDSMDRALNFYFIPERTLMERYKEFSHFKNHPRIYITEGNVIDHKSIRRVITGYYVLDGTADYDENCLMKKYDIKSIAYDRFLATEIILNMKEDDGLDDRLSPFGQGFISMSAPTKEIERLVRKHEIDFLSDEILRWMFGNVKIRRDPAGNIKPDKEKAANKIDGVVALIMAKGEQMTVGVKSGSIYDDESVEI